MCKDHLVSINLQIGILRSLAPIVSWFVPRTLASLSSDSAIEFHSQYTKLRLVFVLSLGNSGLIVLILGVC